MDKGFDLAARLRSETFGGGALELDAADEIERLRRQTAWLIEFETGNNWFSPGWRDEKWHWIWPDANEAVRFARKEDAETVIRTFRRFDTAFFAHSKFIATEHVWVDVHSTQASGAVKS